VDVGSIVLGAAGGLISGLVVAFANHRFAVSQFKKTRLHDERIKLIGQMWGYLSTVEEPLRNLTNRERPAYETPLELATRANTGMSALRAIYLGNRPFLEDTVCDRLEEFSAAATSTLDAWWLSITPGLSGSDPGKFDEAASLAHRQLPRIREEIEAEFRRVLGSDAKWFK